MALLAGEVGKGAEKGGEGKMNVNWLRVGSVALAGFCSSAIASFSVGINQGWNVAFLVAVLQGLLAFALELKSESKKRGYALPYWTLF